MTREEKGVASRLEEKLDILMEGQDRVVRGMYGDKKNDVKGLIQRQAEDEEWRREKEEIIDDYQKKRPQITKALQQVDFIKWGAGAVVSLLGLLALLQKFNVINLF